MTAHGYGLWVFLAGIGSSRWVNRAGVSWAGVLLGGAMRREEGDIKDEN